MFMMMLRDCTTYTLRDLAVENICLATCRTVCFSCCAAMLPSRLPPCRSAARGDGRSFGAGKPQMPHKHSPFWIRQVEDCDLH